MGSILDISISFFIIVVSICIFILFIALLPKIKNLIKYKLLPKSDDSHVMDARIEKKVREKFKYYDDKLGLISLRLGFKNKNKD